jgi:hypothetical protein
MSACRARPQRQTLAARSLWISRRWDISWACAICLKAMCGDRETALRYASFKRSSDREFERWGGG